MTFNEFKKEVAYHRRNLKGQWVWLDCEVEGKNVSIKYIDTYIQRYVIDGIHYPGCCDVSVKEFNKTLEAPFKGAENE